VFSRGSSADYHFLTSYTAVRTILGQEYRPRQRGAMIEWVDPLMAAGNWMPELVQMAGGEDLFGAAGQPSPWLDWEQIVVADPDVVK
jgi:iron complex transport system substrate-binding protein